MGKKQKLDNNNEKEDNTLLTIKLSFLVWVQQKPLNMN